MAEHWFVERGLRWLQAVGRALLVAAAAAALLACEDSPAGPPDNEAPALHGSWRASLVNDVAVPNAMYVWDPVTHGGEEVSVHLVVDSAVIVIDTLSNRYSHDIWVSEWIGQPGGPPLTLNARFHHGDIGELSRMGEDLEFESGWLQNHRMTGGFGADGVLRMQHGFTHGDSAVAFVYGR